MEAAEDIDLSRTSDWRTLGLLSAVFLGHAALLEVLGFAVAGALLFFGVGAALGSRRWARDAAVSVVLATARLRRSSAASSASACPPGCSTGSSDGQPRPARSTASPRR